MQMVEAWSWGIVCERSSSVNNSDSNGNSVVAQRMKNHLIVLVQCWTLLMLCQCYATKVLRHFTCIFISFSLSTLFSFRWFFCISFGFEPTLFSFDFFFFSFFLSIVWCTLRLLQFSGCNFMQMRTNYSTQSLSQSAPYKKIYNFFLLSRLVFIRHCT